MSTDPIRIGIVGIGGRMGQALVREIAGQPTAKLIGGTERPGSALLGKDPYVIAGLEPSNKAVEDTGTSISVVVPQKPIFITDNAAPLFAEADAVIDFTGIGTVQHHAALAAQSKTAYILGTTGLEDEHFEAIRKAARHCAIVQGYNMSLGVHLLAGLVRQVAKSLDDAFDIEIVEMHHRMKVDAPSGTAIMLGEAAAEGRGVSLKDVADRGRDGITGARKKGDIGFASLRGGNVVGEHTVVFAADNERIELTHKAGDRALFARGAVKAALWAPGRAPGLYGMKDVLGL